MKYWNQNFSRKPRAFKSIKPDIDVHPISCLLITDTEELAGKEHRTSVEKVILDSFI